MVYRNYSIFLGVLGSLGVYLTQILGFIWSPRKILVSPDGQHYSVPCTLGTWFEVTITVLASSVTFADNQGCQEIVQSIPSTDETKAIRIGADCTGDCQGSVWDSFEVEVYEHEGSLLYGPPNSRIPF